MSILQQFGKYKIVGLIAVVGAILLSLRNCGSATPGIPTRSPTPHQTMTAPPSGPVAVAPLAPTATLLPINPQPTLPTGGKNLFIEYIMDASGSMLEPMETGATKLAAARQLLADHMRRQPVNTNIGLRVYGHRLHYTDTDKSCQDIELIAPVAPGQGERIGMWLASMQAQGMSPIGLALRQAKADFEPAAGRDNRIVLISDGKETCGIDPCREVEALKSQGFQMIVHVIGIKLDAEARTQLQCVAQKAGGTYQDVKTPQDLSTALDKVTQPQPIEPAPSRTDAPAPGVTASATHALIPPTYTPTPTVITGTPTTTRTATPPSPTATKTVVPPTRTPTARPTVATNTPVPPTQPPPTQPPAPPTQEPPPTKEPAPIPTKPPASTPVP